MSDPSGPVRVIDADTWDVGGDTVRLFGIDAPEVDQTCTDTDKTTWSCGAWASKQVRQRYQGKQATCTTVTTDRYNRIVARCSVDGLDAGRTLVQDGLAMAYRRYAMDYDLDEKGAAMNARGLHASKMMAPSQFRATRVQPAAAPAGDCRIKGNISANGARIYHMPGQRDYAKTRISTAKGEKWFCSEALARQAGWRRAQR